MRDDDINTDVDERDHAVHRARPARAEWIVLFATLVTLYSALPAAIARDLLGVTVPLWPLYFTIYGLVGLILVKRTHLGQMGLRHLPLLAYSTLPLLSAGWSEVPVETILQAATLLGTVVVGLCLATSVPPGAALRLVAVACVCGACLDLLFCIALPRIGVHHDGPWVGTWKGLHDQKNGLGAVSALSIMTLITALRANKRLDVVLIGGLVVAVGLLIASKSTTSWLVAAACTPFTMLGHATRRLAAIVVPAVITGVVAAMIVLPDLASGALEALPQLVGKDSTLSNRLPIWTAVAPFLDERWWLGFGYGAFWSPAHLPSDLFQSQMFFVPTSAHSSYIEVRLALGMVGVAATLAALIYVVVVLAAAHLAEAPADSARDPALPMVLPYVLFLTLTSLTESVLLQRNTITWVIMIWLTGVAAQRAFAPRIAHDSHGSERLQIA